MLSRGHSNEEVLMSRARLTQALPQKKGEWGRRGAAGSSSPFPTETVAGLLGPRRLQRLVGRLYDTPWA